MAEERENNPASPDQSRAYLRRALAALTHLPRVLVVDDCFEDRLLIAHLLGRYHCEISECADPDDAIRLIVTGEFDLLFLDVKLPPGDGVEVLRQIRHLRPAQTVIVITGYDDQAIREKLLDLGPQLMWRKPIKPEDLESIFGTLDTHA